MTRQYLCYEDETFSFPAIFLFAKAALELAGHVISAFLDALIYLNVLQGNALKP